jgi:hypothetical protein
MPCRRQCWRSTGARATLDRPRVGPYDGAVALVDLAVAFVDLLASRVAERILHHAAYSRSGHFVFSIFVTVN